MAGYYGFTLDIYVSVQANDRKLVGYAYVGYLPFILLLSKTSSHPSVFLFLDGNLSKQWIFTKLGMCIDIVEIWFGNANGQISSNFYGVICQGHDNGRVL